MDLSVQREEKIDGIVLFKIDYRKNGEKLSDI